MNTYIVHEIIPVNANVPRDSSQFNSVGAFGDGFVYIIKIEENIYKIGQTKNVLTRMMELYGLHKHEFELLYIIKSNEYKRLEKSIHRKFHSDWIESPFGNEYFKLSENRLQDVLNFCGFRIIEFAKRSKKT
jgi:ribosomal protein S4